MTVLEMKRTAADNDYLHRDFHNILSLGLDYLHDHYGAGTVREYLRRFTLHFHAPLIEEIRRDPFPALKRRFRMTYRDEGVPECPVFDESVAGELLVRISSCPALAHLRHCGLNPSPCFSMTSSVLWQTVCDEAGIGYSLLEYDPRTGRAAHLFYRLDANLEGARS